MRPRPYEGRTEIRIANLQLQRLTQGFAVERDAETFLV